MPAGEAEQLIKSELGISSLLEVFEWIDLQQPLGAASIAQVGAMQLQSLCSYRSVHASVAPCMVACRWWRPALPADLASAAGHAACAMHASGIPQQYSKYTPSHFLAPSAVNQDEM